MEATAARESIGKKVGLYIRENRWNLVFLLLLIAAVCVLSYHAYVCCTIDMEVEDDSFSGTVASYANAMKHQKCRSHGGCGIGCPFISQKDPRVLIRNKINNISSVAEMIKKDLIQSTEETQSYREGLNKELATEAEAILSMTDTTQRSSYDNITSIQSLAQTIQYQTKDSAKLDQSTVFAHNRISALEYATGIHLNNFIASAMRANSYIMSNRLKQLPASDKGLIHDYGQKETEVLSNTINIMNHYKKLFTYMGIKTEENKTDTGYQIAMEAVYDPTSGPDRITDAMIYLYNASNDGNQIVAEMSASYQSLYNVYRNAMAKLDSFSNALPATLGAEDLTKLISDGDYDTALIRTALEPDIVRNHSKFAKERSSFDSGGGVASVRDDDNDLIPWVGLFGRPSYRRSDGTSAETSSEPLRSIPSNNPDQMMRKASPRLSFA